MKIPPLNQIYIEHDESRDPISDAVRNRGWKLISATEDHGAVCHAYALTLDEALALHAQVVRMEAENPDGSKFVFAEKVCAQLRDQLTA